MQFKKAIFYFLLIYSTFGFTQRLDSIIVGYGGGITGEIRFTKFSRYQVQKGEKKILEKRCEAINIPTRLFKRIARKARRIITKVAKVEKPYNMYQFIEVYYTKEKKVYVWGDPNYILPNQIQKFYDFLLKKSSDN
jgi:hypothetical protein